MHSKAWIDRAAVTMAIAGLALGVGELAVGQSDPGVRLVVSGDHIVIASVNAYSPAGMAGMRAGMVAIQLDGHELIKLPQTVYSQADPTPDPSTGEYPAPVPIGVSPSSPVVVVSDPALLATLAAAPVTDLFAVDGSYLPEWRPDTGAGAWVYGDQWRGPGAIAFDVVIGAILLFLVAGWLGSGRAGPSLRDLALPAAAAVAAPFTLWPLEASWSPVGIALFSVLMPVSMGPLAAGIASRIDERRQRRLALAGAAAFAACAIVIGLARLNGPSGVDQAFAIIVLAGGIAAIPGFVAAGQGHATATPATEVPSDDGVASRRLVRAAELAVLGLTPFFAIASAIGPFGFALPFWLLALGLAARLTVRPLARLAGRAQLQRDLIVAATEAERARVAADIHDDALQELTLLVRRLDAAGDIEGAQMARGVSDRLRAICGDLRLPILDDLGIGPALDWLVLRIERLAGGEVRLERSDGSRPPAEVELAFFRVAQEALSNAVRHGKPPIVVRYRSTDGAASLSIDDSGVGIPADAGERAEREGHHFGLLNMAQRAEAIQAILDVRRWPAGGTHVQLEWRAR